MGARVRITLECELCGARNYRTSKAQQVGQQERIKLKKFCPSCRQHTVHRESR